MSKHTRGPWTVDENEMLASTLHGGEMESERKAWVVYTNTDLNEGRGWQFPLHVCDKEATATRLARKAGVMGSDAEVKPVNLVKVGGAWYGPVHIKQSTKEDDCAQKLLDDRRAAIVRARELGLSDEDLRLLRAT